MCMVLWSVFFAHQIFPNIFSLFRISSNILGLSIVSVREYLCGAVGMKEAKPKKKNVLYVFVIWKIFKNSIAWKRSSRI